jgi:hypothetical protein
MRIKAVKNKVGLTHLRLRRCLAFNCGPGITALQRRFSTTSPR